MNLTKNWADEDLIDSREIIDRITELEEQEEEYQAALDEYNEDSYNNPQPKREDYLDEEEQVELEELKELDEAAPAADWHWGATMIAESYFETYAETLAEDIGAIDRNANWPLNCIDWEEAASQLKVDYTTVEAFGVTWYVR